MAGRNQNADVGSFQRRSASRVNVAFASVVLLTAACSDGPTAPQGGLDPAAVSQVLPAVTDARLRLAPNISNPVIRDRAVFDISELEGALQAGDAQRARFHVRVTENVLTEYMSGGASLADGPDVTAIALVLHQVSRIVNGGFEVALFP